MPDFTSPASRKIAAIFPVFRIDFHAYFIFQDVLFKTSSPFKFVLIIFLENFILFCRTHFISFVM